MAADNAPLAHFNYEIAFETVLERMMEKVSFINAVREDHRNINPGSMMHWILANPERKARYYQALETRAELLSEEIISIADGVDTMEDIDRSKFRCAEYRKQMANWNRKRFGDVKQIDMTQSISISAAIEEADRRVSALYLDNVTDVT